jgi:outer membrane protein
MKDNYKLVLIMLLSIGLAVAYFEFRNSNKLVVVDLKTMFDQFDMKKEYEKKFISIKETRQRTLDSLALKLRMIASESAELTKEEMIYARDLKVQYLTKEKEIGEDNMRLTTQYDKEVISRMLLYSKEFAKEKGYKIVYGSDGNGTILYYQEKLDVTKELVDYINNSYAGKKE